MPIARRRSPPSTPRGLAIDIVETSGASTISANDIEAILQSSDAGDVTYTLPRNLPVGFYCYIEQGGAGVITCAAGTGATLVNRQSFVKTAGQYALISLHVRANPGGQSAVWALNGDGAVA
jgi:hypothetical protein